MEQGRLADVARRLDAECFVGRSATLQRFEDVLAAEDRTATGMTPRIVHVSGPGGIGKSALLREFARRAAAAGRPVIELLGGDIGADPATLRDTFSTAPEHAVVLVDDVEQLAALHVLLRDTVGELPASVVVVLAGRPAPGPEWHERGYDLISTSVALQPLDADAAREMLRLRAVEDPGEQDELLRWAAGYPLALAVAATVHSRDATTVDGRPVDHHANLADALLARLGGDELADVDPDVLDVACLVPAVDGRLLAAALPGHPTRAGLTQLRASSLAERHGTKVVLHRSVRSALRERLRSTDPDRYRTLVLRIADHLRTRSLTEDRRHLLELAELIEDPAIRVGFEPSTTYYADRGTTADIATLRASVGAHAATVDRLERWVVDAPEHTVAVRRYSGELAALAVVCEGGRLPPWAHEDPAIGPNVEHAATTGRSGAAFMGNLVLAVRDLDAEELAEVLLVGNGGIVRMVSTLPRYMYVTDSERRADGVELLGYAEVPELRRDGGGTELFALLLDAGPDGVVGALHDVVRAEQGARDVETRSGQESALLAAVRGYLDDEAMAASELGAGTGAQRAASARAEVRRAVETAFADTPGEQSLRRALELAYLVPGGGHAAARNELHMSRSSFYRQLQKARQLLVERTGQPAVTVPIVAEDRSSTIS